MGERVVVADPGAAEGLPYPECLQFSRELAGRRREASPRREPVPEFVEVPFQVLLELGDRLPVNSGRPFVVSNFPVCLSHQPLVDVKRFLLQVTHSLLPIFG